MHRVLRSRFGFGTLGSAALLALCFGCLRSGTPAATQPTPSVDPAPAQPTPEQNSMAVAPTKPAPKPATDRDSEPGWGIVDVPEQVTYAEVVRRVTSMVEDGEAQRQVTARGLNLINVTWEDTGRSLGSSVGPNISDLTLQVRYTESAEKKAALLPVIRFPNFTDRTGDVRADKFFLRVGNHKRGGQLETVSLRDVLQNVKAYLSDPRSVLGSGNLTAARDSHYLVSAQAVFLPIPSEGKAEFTPVLFNYQSYPESPAVLSLLVSRQGTSITIIDNHQNQSSPVQSWGQELYFNEAGQRAPFSAERRSDVKARIEAQGGPSSEDDRSALAKGADALFVIQVPLRQKRVPRPLSSAGSAGGAPVPQAPAAAYESAAPAPAAARARTSDVEQAVLGHGRIEGKFEEGGNLQLERDDRFPIRVTVQFYKATSNGVVSSSDLDSIATAIGSVYEHADYVGSLVVPEGDRLRPTEWQSSSRLFPY